MVKYLNLKSNYWPLVVVLIFYFWLGLFYLSHQDWNPTAFVVFGQKSEITKLFAGQNLKVSSDPTGYDGQFFYFLAHNPFAYQTFNQVSTVPTWRYQRIIYPLVVYLLSGFGQLNLVAIFLPLVNLLAILGSVYLLIKVLDFYHLPHWWALFYSLSPGLFYSFLYNLAEPLAYFFVIAGVYYFLKERIYPTVIFLTLAVLTKETCIFIPLVLVIYFLFNKSQGRLKKIIFYSLPIIIFLFWFITLKIIFPADNHLAMVNSNVGLPLAGFLTKFKILFSQPINFIAIADLFFFTLFFVSLTFVLLKLTANQNNIFLLITILFGVFIITFGRILLLFPKEYTRHFLGFFLFLFFSQLTLKSRLLFVLLTLYLFSSLFFLTDILALNFFR